MTSRLLRATSSTWLALVLLAACGGGGSGGAATGLATGQPVGGTSASSGQSGLGTSAAAQATASGSTSDTGGPGTSSSTGAGTASGSTGGSGAGGSTSASTSASAASGAGSGSGSGDSSGVGSGGTGASSADASTSVGSVDGLGSIILNGIRYDTTGAQFDLRDTPELQIGMTAKVIGPIDAGFVSGNALRIESAADLRGAVTSIDGVNASFSVLGTTVSTDPATVWANLAGLAALPVGSYVQVWALPGAPGTLRATRVERVTVAALPILTGSVQNLDVSRQTFDLGGLTVGYGIALALGTVDASALVEGTLVRIRADSLFGGGVLLLSTVQRWNPVDSAEGSRTQLAGIVTGYGGLGSFKVLGYPVDASSAQITGGQAANIGNGVKVEVGGTVRNGVLRTTRLKIAHVPGTGGPSSFNVIGTVGAFRSAADFRVRGQLVDASGAGVQFVNGGVGSLGNGAKVSIVGSQVSNGVLVAERVTFD